MNEASDLIERMERETSQRIDDNGGDNNAMAGLIGLMARMMGETAHTNYANDPKMDVPVGLYIKLTDTDEHKTRERRQAILLEMLRAGMSPEELLKL